MHYRTHTYHLCINICERLVHVTIGVLVIENRNVWLKTRSTLRLRIKDWKQQPLLIHILFISDYYHITLLPYDIYTIFLVCNQLDLQVSQKSKLYLILWLHLCWRIRNHIYTKMSVCLRYTFSFYNEWMQTQHNEVFNVYYFFIIENCWQLLCFDI
jgi:hypothetical protein